MASSEDPRLQLPEGGGNIGAWLSPRKREDRPSPQDKKLKLLH
jgi:hypothetical protein